MRVGFFVLCIFTHIPILSPEYALAPCNDGREEAEAVMIDILLADDHPVVLMGVRSSLTQVQNKALRIVGQAASSGELITLLRQVHCDLLITDFCMPCEAFPDGLTLIGYIRRQHPSMAIIVMSMLKNPTTLRELRNLGVLGLFDKRCALDTLPQAIRDVLGGRSYLSPRYRHLLLEAGEACSPLSPKEQEVLRLVGDGLSGRDIALRLNRSEKTISRHKRSAMLKLGLKHDRALIDYVQGLGQK